MSEQSRAQFSELNGLYKQIDDLYHAVDVRFGLSDSAMTVLYGLTVACRPCTQKELCDTWSIRKQTLRSALSQLIRDGVVYLEPDPQNVHIKYIVLTEAGQQLAARTALPLYQAEQAAFARLTDAERTALLTLTRKQVRYLRKEINALSTQGVPHENSAF